MQKNRWLLIGIVGSCAAMLTMKSVFTDKKDKLTIGIIQTATHPALDAVRVGFINTINEHFENNVQIIHQNAQGNISNAHSIAQNMHTNKEIDLFFAIATPATQSLITVEKKRPIIFSAVTDPKAAGIVGPETTNVCGVTDRIDIHKQIDLLQTLLPKAKTVGLLFNKGEVNAQVMVAHIKEELDIRNIHALEFGVTNETEVGPAAETACRKADVILSPIDNTVACTISLIASIAEQMHTPVMVSDNLLVSKGALAAHGIDYDECGKSAAELTIKILNNQIKSHSMPILNAECKRAVINKKMLKTLGISLPIDIHNVELIEDQEAK